MFVMRGLTNLQPHKKLKHNKYTPQVNVSSFVSQCKSQANQLSLDHKISTAIYTATLHTATWLKVYMSKSCNQYIVD